MLDHLASQTASVTAICDVTREKLNQFSSLVSFLIYQSSYPSCKFIFFSVFEIYMSLFVLMVLSIATSILILLYYTLKYINLLVIHTNLVDAYKSSDLIKNIIINTGLVCISSYHTHSFIHLFLRI